MSKKDLSQYLHYSFDEFDSNMIKDIIKQNSMIETIEIIEFGSQHCQDLIALRKEYPRIIFKVNATEVNLPGLKHLFMSSNFQRKLFTY